MSRLRRMRAKAGAVPAYIVVAPIPGPPARTNNGSLALRRLIAGARAMKREIMRPCGAAGFSGTSSVPHSAASTLKCDASSIWHGASDRGFGVVGCDPEVDGAALAATAQAPATTTPRRRDHD